MLKNLIPKNLLGTFQLELYIFYYNYSKHTYIISIAANLREIFRISDGSPQIFHPL